MKKIAALVALAGIAGVAAAQPGDKTYIDVKARVKGTTTWLDTVNWNAPDLTTAADIEVGVFYFRNAGFGLATVVHNVVLTGAGANTWQPAAGDSFSIVDRADSTQHPDGRQGNFNFGGQAQDGYTTANSATNDTGRLRIAAKNNTQDALGGGISIKQNTPVALGASFDQKDGVLGYRFDIKIVNTTPGSVNSRSFDGDAPKSRVNSYRMYATDTSTSATDIIASLLDSDKVSITANWVPAPASLALLGLGGLAAGRRRR